MNRIRLSNPVEGVKFLEKLPDDFAAVQVNPSGLQRSVWRRFVRDIEFQFDKSNAVFGNDKDQEDFTEYLIQVLNEQGFDTKDVKKAFIVIGNKNGALSGFVYNQTHFERFKTDISQFEIDYPVFLDTSSTRILFSDDAPVAHGKRERLEDTISVVPEPKKPNPETIADLQAQWAEQEEQYQKQIATLMERESKQREHNEELIQECTDREEELQKAVAECSNSKKEYERNCKRS